jgi:2-amino-4-hydroxy-6-hydroxymethyldihydropteridine diphosphokinase
MIEAVIGLGSNIEPEKYTPMALDKLSQYLNVTAISPFYRTAAIGTALGQSDFINGIVIVETELSAHQLKFNILREIEFELGRKKAMPKHAARTMDLDLLAFGDEIIAELKIPEPDLINRSFVFRPLLDVRPKFVIPGMTSPLSSLVSLDEKIDVWTSLSGKAAIRKKTARHAEPA